MNNSDDSKASGPPAIKESRRKGSGFQRIPPRFLLWLFVAVAAWAIIYWKIDQNQVESWRNRLLAQQRAVASELGPRYAPLRDQFESWTLEAAGPYSGDFLLEQAKSSDFRSKPGVYLRVFIDDAKDVEIMRRAAMDSLRDGFTSCFTTYPNPDPFDGPACQKSHECETGKHCNENFRCTVPAQPYNLRVGYRASRILYDDWVNDVRQASNDMRLRLLERDYESAVKDDIPLVIELMTHAQYFLLVLDEEAEKPTEVPDAGTYSESLQAVKHPVRVFAWDLKSKSLLFRMRTSTMANVGIATQSARIAILRQSNNCAIALEVRKFLGDESAQ